jgi:hypothetical protein
MAPMHVRNVRTVLFFLEVLQEKISFFVPKKLEKLLPACSLHRYTHAACHASLFSHYINETAYYYYYTG